MKHRPLLIALVAFVAISAASASEARPGFRVGVTDDIDSIFGGFEFGMPLTRLGPSTLVFEPAFDLAITEDPVDFFIRGTFNFEFHFALSGNTDIYPLVGPTVVYYKADNFDETEIGINFGFGFGMDRFSFELWLGTDDIPDITAVFGVTF